MKEDKIRSIKWYKFLFYDIFYFSIIVSAHKKKRLYVMIKSSWWFYRASCPASWELSAPSSIFFRILLLFNSIIPTSHILFHYILDSPVGAHTSGILSTIWHVLALRHSCLLAKHTIALYIVVLLRLVIGFLRAQDTSPCLSLLSSPCGLVTVRERGCHSIDNILDLRCCPFPFIFNLDWG